MKQRQKGAETESGKGRGKQGQREAGAGTKRGRDVVLRSGGQAGKRDGVGTQQDFGQGV